MTEPDVGVDGGRHDHDLEYHAPSTGNRVWVDAYKASVAIGPDGGRFGSLVARVWIPWGRVGILVVLLLMVVLITRVV